VGNHLRILGVVWFLFWFLIDDWVFFWFHGISVVWCFGPDDRGGV